MNLRTRKISNAENIVFKKYLEQLADCPVAEIPDWISEIDLGANIFLPRTAHSMHFSEIRLLFNFNSENSETPQTKSQL